MKWFSKAALGGLLWLTFSAAAFGDTLYLSQSFNIDQGGQFTGHLASNPSQTLLLYCVDYRNEMLSGIDVNIGTPLSMADISNTRYGTTTTSTASTFGPVPNPPYTAVDRYAMAAWLTTQYNFSTMNTSRDDSIQNAVWELLDVQNITFTTGGSVAQWISNAEAWEASLSMPALTAFESSVRIYTSTDVGTDHDLNQMDPGNRYITGTQEMIGIVATPEPGTIAMLGTGLLAIGLFVRRRIKA